MFFTLDVSRETLKRIFGTEMVEDRFEEVLDFILKKPDEYRQKVMDLYAGQRHENVEICKKCGGKCCLHAPCHWSPDDIGEITYKNLKKILRKKKYISILRLRSRICEASLEEFSVDGPYFYVLRTRTMDTGIAAAAGFIEEDDYCMLLGKNGCAISYDERPKGARDLIPNDNGRCEQLYGMDECLKDWKEHQDVLKKLYKYFERIETLKCVFHIR